MYAAHLQNAVHKIRVRKDTLKRNLENLFVFKKKINLMIQEDTFVFCWRRRARVAVGVMERGGKTQQKSVPNT